MGEYKFIKMEQSERAMMCIDPGAHAYKATNNNSRSGGCCVPRTLTKDERAACHINGPGEVVIAIIDARPEEAEMFRSGEITPVLPAPMPAGAAVSTSDETETFTLIMTGMQLVAFPPTAIIASDPNLTARLLGNGKGEPTDEDELTDEDEEKPRTNCCC